VFELEGVIDVKRCDLVEKVWWSWKGELELGEKGVVEKGVVKLEKCDRVRKVRLSL